MDGADCRLIGIVLGKSKSKVLIIYIVVLRNLGLLQDRFNNTPLIIGPIHGSYKQHLKHINPHKVPNYTAW